jgi:hypothetical protein
MRGFVGYLLAFGRRSSRPAFFLTILLLALLVAINYKFGIERRILDLGPWYVSYGGFVAFYAGVIAVAWGLQYKWAGAMETAGTKPGSGMGTGAEVFVGSALRPDGSPDLNRGLLRLLALAPLFFAAKMVHWDLSALLPGNRESLLNRYWVVVTQLPAKFLLLAAMLWGCWKAGWLGGAGGEGPVAIDDLGNRAAGMSGFAKALGLTPKGFAAKPYFLLLLPLVPLVALASTQPDFLQIYPKVKTVAFMNGYPGPIWPWKAGYELSYGIDFLSIELFFRGLLVIGVVRYAGERAILPMAAFYCTIHFGKPLGECISSFVGGLVLGVLAYRTRSILGGLIVHLGLAWMMEIGGWAGRMLYIR